METPNQKAAFNARAKASMRQFLRAKSWEEKVKAIERMNVASKLARQAMRDAMAKQEPAVKRGDSIPSSE